jgi:hypothetical protein
MDDIPRIIAGLEKELLSKIVPRSVEELHERLNPLMIGVIHQIPVILHDTRMFRVRRIPHKPASIDEVGAPPITAASTGRLNNEGQSLLYLADSPGTAFAEANVVAGEEVCLSEWRIDVPLLATANGGIPPTMLAERFSKKKTGSREQPSIPTAIDEEILSLFRKIYTLDVGKNPALYRWSIAAGLAGGFSHQIERTATEMLDGNTHWTGRYPLAAIAYPSVKLNLTAVNFAFNDQGRTHVRLDHVQWVRRLQGGDGGSFTSLDFANRWDGRGQILWKNRPANFILKSGERAKMTKVAENTWSYETSDGSLPWYG